MIAWDASIELSVTPLTVSWWFSEIVWHCVVCGNNGVIHGWEDTLWNRQPGREHDPPIPGH